jgi:hypothetical protein
MSLEKYIQVAKEEFPYLFHEYEFQVVFKEEEEMQGLGRGGDAFGLESDMYKMRILFSRRGGGDGIMFGPTSASFYVDDPSSFMLTGVPFEWVEIANLLWYLNRQHADWSELEQERKKPLTKRDLSRVSFRIQSRLLKPHCPRVFEMFGSSDAIAAWKPDYERYIHEHD